MTSIIHKKESSISLLVFLIFFLYTWRNSIRLIAPNLESLVLLVLRLIFVVFLVLSLIFMKKISKDTALSGLWINITFIIYFLIHIFWAYSKGTPSLMGIMLCVMFSFLEDGVKAKVYLFIRTYLLLVSLIGIVLYPVCFFKLPIVPYISFIR